MANRYHIEKMRDMLTSLEYEAQFLYQYGNLSSSLDLFDQLSDCDKKRLIALALTEGNSDVQNVARCLLAKLNPRPANLNALLSQMSPEDRAEAETYGVQTSSQNERPQLTPALCSRILEELQAGCSEIGSQELEQAYWILIPAELEDDATWIEAMGGEDDFYSHYGSPYEVGYNLGQDKKYELLTDMREASWILHIHNHPVLPWLRGICLPSDQDRNAAMYWKSLWPELAGKMMFFVIQANMAVEYSAEPGWVRRWI
jgi:hypothetical protein